MGNASNRQPSHDKVMKGRRSLLEMYKEQAEKQKRLDGEQLTAERLFQSMSRQRRQSLKSLLQTTAVSEYGEPAMLSVEDVEILLTLQDRYAKNMLTIPFHQEFPWEEIEAKLRANPAKLKTLHAMEEEGNIPTAFKVVDGAVSFGELVGHLKDSRRNVSYLEAKRNAENMGAKLMSQDDFFYIGRPESHYDPDLRGLGIVLEARKHYAIFLDSEHRPDLLARGKVLQGVHRNGLPRYMRASSSASPYVGFRCVVEISPKVT